MCMFELACKWIPVFSYQFLYIQHLRLSYLILSQIFTFCDPAWKNRAYVFMKFDYFLDYELRFHNFVQRVAMVGTSVFYFEVPTILFWYNSEITNWYIIVYLPSIICKYQELIKKITNLYYDKFLMILVNLLAQYTMVYIYVLHNDILLISASWSIGVGPKYQHNFGKDIIYYRMLK